MCDFPCVLWVHFYTPQVTQAAHSSPVPGHFCFQNAILDDTKVRPCIARCPEDDFSQKLTFVPIRNYISPKAGWKPPPVWAEILVKWLKALFQHLMSTSLQQLLRGAVEPWEANFACSSHKGQKINLCVSIVVAPLRSPSGAGHTSNTVWKVTGCSFRAPVFSIRINQPGYSRTWQHIRQQHPQPRAVPSSIHQYLLLPSVASTKFP